MDKFNFFVKADFEKSQSEVGSDDFYKNMIIWGQASTNDVDLDDEILEPSGYDLKSFLTKGLINYEHLAKSRSPLYYIGEPIDAKIKDNKFFIKAKLWEKSKMARDLWDTLHIMKSSGSGRGIGWSIEGQPLEKDKDNAKRITKARITHTALTFMPKNANTWAQIVKGEQEEDYIEAEEEVDSDVLYTFKKGEKEYIVKSDLSTIEKAICTGGEMTGTDLVGKINSGAGLKKEDLDSNLKVLTNQPEKVVKLLKKLKKVSKKKQKKVKDALFGEKGEKLKSFLKKE